VSPKSSADYEQAEKHLTDLGPELVEIRRHLHSHPELSGREFETTAFLSRRLADEGIAHRLGPGGLGVITEIVEGPSRTVAIRADIDALPIAEENDFPHRSQIPGVMHACGHDAHTTMALGAMIALRRAELAPVGWRGIFQSSEESGHGALELWA
jgi:amidohydrolase